MTTSARTFSLSTLVVPFRQDYHHKFRILFDVCE